MKKFRSLQAGRGAGVYRWGDGRWGQGRGIEVGRGGGVQVGRGWGGVYRWGGGGEGCTGGEMAGGDRVGV